MDVAMPVVDGIEATRRLRELLPRRGSSHSPGSTRSRSSRRCSRPARARTASRARRSGSSSARSPAPASRSSAWRTLARPRALRGRGQLLARELVELTAALVRGDVPVLVRRGALAGRARRRCRTRDRLAARPASSSARSPRRRRARPTPTSSPSSTGWASRAATRWPCRWSATATASARCSSRCPRTSSSSSTPQLVAAVADLAASSLAQERRAGADLRGGAARRADRPPEPRAFDEHMDAAARGRRATPPSYAPRRRRVQGRQRPGGHAAGDEVLASLARVLLRAVRATSRCSESEETSSPRHRGLARSRRARGRAILRALAFSAAGRALPTLSVGVAALGGVEEAGTVVNADNALYQAKGGGAKDRASPPGPRPHRAAGICRPRAPDASPGPPATRARSGSCSSTTTRPAVLLRTTFEIIDSRSRRPRAPPRPETDRRRPPDVIVLDVAMP